MLTLRWICTPAGNPDDAGYAATIDRLCADDPADLLQGFRRGDHGLAAAEPALAAALDAWLGRRSDPAEPVRVMVHGFEYDPSGSMGGGADDPSHSVYGTPGVTYPGSAVPLDAHLSWLPLVGECDASGKPLADCAVAFAWTSEGTFATFADACWDNGYKYAALDLAPAAARALACVLAYLAGKTKLRVLAHSLGTRTFTQAAALLPAAACAALDRVVLLGGAEYCVDALQNLAGTCDVISFASGQDDVLGLGQMACDPVRHNGTVEAMVLGRKGLRGRPRWLNLQLDNPAVVAWCSEGHAPTGTAYGVSAAPQNDAHPNGGLGHWVYYTNDGNRELVHDLVTEAEMTLAGLQAGGVPAGVVGVDGSMFSGVKVPTTPMTCEARKPIQLAQRGGRGATAVG